MKSTVTLDFETYYSKDYTLKKLTTEQYIRDPAFKVHGVGVMVDGEVRWITENIRDELLALELDKRPVLCHHAHFDGFILSHHYDIHPALFLDTLSMGRALGVPRLSLNDLAMRYALGMKNAEALVNLEGVLHPDAQQLAALGEYCINDVRLTRFLFDAMREAFPIDEIRTIDLVVKMFTRPLLRIDKDVAKATAASEAWRVHSLLEENRFAKDMLMSNLRFADMLRSLGVAPPVKTSLATGKETYAFAKSDKEFTALLDHPDPQVQALVSARLGTKSTIMRTRAEALAGISGRGAWPVYLRYSGARQTHRFSGADKVNPQNFTRGSLLRKAVCAPDGHALVPCDSSNIELRLGMYLAGQTDVVEQLRRGEDLYCDFASRMYGKTVTKKDKAERQAGKIAMLGLGYGMGWEKFRETARLNGVVLDEAEARRVVDLYRRTYPQVVNLWGRAQRAIEYIRTGTPTAIDSAGLCVTGQNVIYKPAGMPLLYDGLQVYAGEGGRPEYRFNGYDEETGKPREKYLYGGKVVENIVQSLARDIICEQMIKIAARYPVALQVHDEIVCVVRKGQEAECAAFMIEVMSTPPEWAPGLPLAAEADWSFRYGDCK